MNVAYPRPADNTNQAEHELYAAIAENDNAGYPIAYCLLTTATVVSDGKRKLSLQHFMEKVRDTYNINLKFVHTDKDIAEIKAAQATWPSSKHQLCWWHLWKAIREWLSKVKLSTTAYHPTSAKAVYSFINIKFAPDTPPDPKEYEDKEYEPGVQEPRSKKGKKDKNKQPLPLDTTSQPLNPNAIFVKLPITQSFKEAHPVLETSKATNKPHYEKETQFCPVECHQDIVDMVECHLNMHPSIPGPHAPTVDGIHEWCACEMYQYCKKNGLRSCWAYLWSNWYKPERWKLWARCESHEIPRLRTTMICEAQ